MAILGISGQLAQWVADTASMLMSSGEESPSPPESMVSFRALEPLTNSKTRKEPQSTQSNGYSTDNEIKAKGKIVSW